MNNRNSINFGFTVSNKWTNFKEPKAQWHTHRNYRVKGLRLSVAPWWYKSWTPYILVYNTVGVSEAQQLQQLLATMRKRQWRTTVGSATPLL